MKKFLMLFVVALFGVLHTEAQQAKATPYFVWKTIPTKPDTKQFTDYLSVALNGGKIDGATIYASAQTYKSVWNDNAKGVDVYAEIKSEIKSGSYSRFEAGPLDGDEQNTGVGSDDSWIPAGKLVAGTHGLKFKLSNGKKIPIVKWGTNGCMNGIPQEKEPIMASEDPDNKPDNIEDDNSGKYATKEEFNDLKKEFKQFSSDVTGVLASINENQKGMLVAINNLKEGGFNDPKPGLVRNDEPRGSGCHHCRMGACEKHPNGFDPNRLDEPGYADGRAKTIEDMVKEMEDKQKLKRIQYKFDLEDAKSERKLAKASGVYDEPDDENAEGKKNKGVFWPMFFASLAANGASDFVVNPLVGNITGGFANQGRFTSYNNNGFSSPQGFYGQQGYPQTIINDYDIFVYNQRRLMGRNQPYIPGTQYPNNPVTPWSQSGQFANNGFVGSSGDIWNSGGGSWVDPNGFVQTSNTNNNGAGAGIWR